MPNPTAKALAAGRSEEKHGVCRLFVVTDVPDDSGRMRFITKPHGC